MTDRFGDPYGRLLGVMTTQARRQLAAGGLKLDFGTVLALEDPEDGLVIELDNLAAAATDCETLDGLTVQVGDRVVALYAMERFLVLGSVEGGGGSSPAPHGPSHLGGADDPIPWDLVHDMGPGGVATDPEKAGYVRFRTDENGGTLYIADAGGDFTKVAPGLTEVGASTASTWFTGSGAPAGGTGVVGDWYLDTATGELYQKTGASAWTLRATAWVPVTGGIRNIGMVGIGPATAPTEMLEVSANVAGTAVGSANLKMSYSSSPSQYANFIRNVFSGTAANHLMEFVLKTAGVEHVLLTLTGGDRIIFNGSPVFNGDVGVNIGTAVPSAALHVASGTITNGPILALSYTDPNYRAIVKGTWSGAVLASNKTTYYMRTGIDSTERPIWTASGDGKLGVGTQTAPTSQLDVIGDVAADTLNLRSPGGTKFPVTVANTGVMSGITLPDGSVAPAKLVAGSNGQFLTTTGGVPVWGAPVAGAPGSRWYSGTGAPAGGTGIVGDWYLNDANGDVYEKTGTSTWTLRDNLTGPPGVTTTATYSTVLGANQTIASTTTDIPGFAVTVAKPGVYLIQVMGDCMQTAAVTTVLTLQPTGTGVTLTHSVPGISMPGTGNGRSGIEGWGILTVPDTGGGGVPVGAGCKVTGYSTSASATTIYTGNSAISATGISGPVGPKGDPGSPTPSVVTALPGSPTHGQEIYYRPSGGNLWHLRYDSGWGDAYKWEFLGGAPLVSTVAAQEATLATTTWHNLTTDGPLIVVPLAGYYDVDFTALFTNTDGSQCTCGAGVAVGNTTPDLQSLGNGYLANANAGWAQLGFATMFPVALTAGAFLRVRYYINAHAASRMYSGRHLLVKPRRVG